MTSTTCFFGAQAAIDRVIRRLRLGAPPVPGRRRLLVVQIDGLSRAVLEQALARRAHAGPPASRRPRRAPALPDDRGDSDVHAGLPDGGDVRRPAGHSRVPLPRQAAADRHSLPARRPRGVRRGEPGREPPGHPAGGQRLRMRVHRGRGERLLQLRPALPARGCRVSSGSSRHSCWSPGWRPSARRSPATELVRTLGRIARRPSQRESAWRWFKKKIGISVWTRQWFTFAVARDVYDGVPAIYVNYLDHDEAAHAFGPRSRHAFAGLRAVDRSLRQIRRALRRVPEHRYDLYVLSDHGQAACTPYSELTGGQRFERAFFEEILTGMSGPEHGRVSPSSSEDGVDRPCRERRGGRNAGPAHAGRRRRPRLRALPRRPRVV